MIVKLTKNADGTFSLRNKKGTAKADRFEAPTLAEKMKTGESLYVWGDLHFTEAGPKLHVETANVVKGQRW
jgi:hypothetical protein